jgi:hypothetical protein
MSRPATAEDILDWLAAYACRVDFQDLNTSVRREKNRVILSYRVPSGAIATVGGRDLRSAVLKAVVRLEFTV